MPAPSHDRSDQELARQSQAGELAGFEELVRRYEVGVYRFLTQCCRQPADAEDLTQITFVTAYRAIQQYRRDCSFAAWLFTIARRKLIDHYRTARPESSTETAPESSDANDPSVILSRREEAGDLWARARRLLPRDQFAALWLRHQQDLSVKETALALHRTQASTKVLMFRARQTLMRRLRSPEAGTVPARRGTSGAETVQACPVGGGALNHQP